MHGNGGDQRQWLHRKSTKRWKQCSPQWLCLYHWGVVGGGHVASVSEILSTQLKGENRKTENSVFTLTLSWSGEPFPAAQPLSARPYIQKVNSCFSSWTSYTYMCVCLLPAHPVPACPFTVYFNPLSSVWTPKRSVILNLQENPFEETHDWFHTVWRKLSFKAKFS